ncbi:MAG: hypothetical protein QOE14_1103 [Humisphaera sp.]|nr:hypothetical protein [Humisphaera sp.]
MANATSYINPQQVGGIESYVFADGEGFGTRALLVNTGGGLRYRVLPDRGLDIDQAFFNQHSLAFLTHKGVTKPSRGYDRGADWLKSFPGGLLTSCGPLNIGPPTTDAGEVGLHGTHSNTPATIESIVQPDPRRGRGEMSVTAVVRYGQLYGPCVELRRTIVSRLGANAIEVTDEFFNAGNAEVPHAWLLHINFGYPLVDAGAEICFDAKVEPRDDDASRKHFRASAGAKFKNIPAPLESHRGETSAVAYLFPKSDKQGRATLGIVNKKLGVAVAVRYNTREFGRCGNWQHFGPGEYVTALEPMNGTVDGRDKDRARGLLDALKAGARKTYRYTIEVVTDRAGIDDLRALNR